MLPSDMAMGLNQTLASDLLSNLRVRSTEVLLQVTLIAGGNNQSGSNPGSAIQPGVKSNVQLKQSASSA